MEGKTGLYVFFKTVCDEYGLIQTENYTIPPEAEGLEPKEVNRDTPIADQPPAGMSLLRRSEGAGEEQTKPEPVGNEIIATGDTTKRHRHTASNHSVSTTIAEEAEEDEDVSKPSLGRAPTVKKEGGLSRSDTLRPGLSSESVSETEPEPEAAHGPVVLEEPKPEDIREQADPQHEDKNEDEDAEDEAEITVIESEVPEDTEGPGESAAEKPAEEVKAETIVESS